MSEVESPYRTTVKPKRTRIHHLREMKERGERWPMLTAYDMYSAQIFDEAGIPVLLVVLYGMYQFVGVFGAGTLVDLLETKLFAAHLSPWAMHATDWGPRRSRRGSGRSAGRWPWRSAGSR